MTVSSATTTGRARLAAAAARRWLRPASLVYVGAWVAGLLAAPAAPDPAAPAGTVHAWYLAHQQAALRQSLLVHGLAGIALAVVAAALLRMRRHPGVLAAGLAAAAVSLVQVALEVTLAAHVAGGGAATGIRALFAAVNDADTVKLVALGAFVAVTTAAFRDALPCWLAFIGLVLAPLLPVGGLAFLFPNPILDAALTASLPLLLVWVAAVGLTAGPEPRQ